MVPPFINIHTHTPLPDSGLYSYGIHPWWLCHGEQNETIQKDFELLEKLLKENRIAAIGEMGIDSISQATLSQQIEVFEKQIPLSEHYQKPLVIHNVHGTNEILRLHKKHKPKQLWILHGFNGTVEEARQLTDKNLFLSVGESIFYPNRKISATIKAIPLDHLFLETDVSQRSIQEVYKKVAELLNLPIEILKQRLFDNFEQLKLTARETGNDRQGRSSETVALINLERGVFCASATINEPLNR